MTIDALRQLHFTNVLFLRWALLAWIISIAAAFGLSETSAKDYAEPLYQTISLAGTLGLVLFGLLHAYFGVVKDFSVSQILLTAAALFVGGVGSSTLVGRLAPIGLIVGGALFVGSLAAIRHWQIRGDKAAKDAPARPQDDATIRGGVSIFKYGHDAYRLVARNSTGKNTPAERFEKRLILYLERVLGVSPLSMAGSETSYWRFRLGDDNPVELSVVGPGYNSSAKIREGERWLLRIREPKEGVFAAWIAKHFPDGAGVARNLGTEIQTQFASSRLSDDKAFFDQEIPLLTMKCSEPGNDNIVMIVRQRKEASEAENDDEASCAVQSKVTLH